MDKEYEEDEYEGGFEEDEETHNKPVKVKNQNQSLPLISFAKKQKVNTIRS